MIFLLSMLTSAQAGPYKGVRLGLCAGLSTSCNTAQLELGINFNQFALKLGGGIFNLKASAQYYLSSNEEDFRTFVGLHYALGYPYMLHQYTSVELGLGTGYGLSFGGDLHLLENKRLIVTPQVSIDYVNHEAANSGSGGGAIVPAIGVGIGYALF